MDGEVIEDDLFDEAMGLLGMIDEVRAKAQMSLNQILYFKTKNIEKKDEYLIVNQMHSKIQEFQNSLRKYEQRLKEIHCILEAYFGPDFV